MTDPTPYPVLLAEDIAHRIGLLNEALAQAPPRQAALILGQVLDADEGILGRLTALVENGSRAAKTHAETGAFPPEVWLALGRAANDLNGLCVDLDDHADDFRRLGYAPQSTSATAAVRPTASPLVARRRR